MIFPELERISSMPLVMKGIVCGLSAIYAGLAQVLNEMYGRVVLPLCPVKK